jgi:hypothetical protein
MDRRARPMRPEKVLLVFCHPDYLSQLRITAPVTGGSFLLAKILTNQLTKGAIRAERYTQKRPEITTCASQFGPRNLGV